MIFHVKQRHIDSGVPKSPSRCMLAQAFMEDMPERTSIRVGIHRVFLTDRDPEHPRAPDKFTHITLPEEAVRKVAQFDSGQKVEPFSFEI